MKVLDSFRPAPGRLAMQLHCKCVVELRGHRGPTPKEHPCEKHDTKIRTRPSPTSTMRGVEPSRRARRSRGGRAAGQGARTQAASPPASSSVEGRGLSAGRNSSSDPATPIVASSSVERPSSPTCVACGREKKIAAKGLCWSCYAKQLGPSGMPSGIKRRNENGNKASTKSPPAAPLPPAELPAPTVTVKAPSLPASPPKEPEAIARVRLAVVQLFSTQRSYVLNPEGFNQALEAVERAARVAGWFDDANEKSTHGTAHAARAKRSDEQRRAASGERRAASGERRADNNVTPGAFRRAAEGLLGPERARAALEPHGDEVR